jgi:hypothetical protein
MHLLFWVGFLVPTLVEGMTSGMASVLTSLVQDEVAEAVQTDSLILEQLRVDTDDGQWRTKKEGLVYHETLESVSYSTHNVLCDVSIV